MVADVSFSRARSLVESDDIAGLRRVIELGFNVNELDDTSWSVLFYAARRASLAMVVALVDLGADATLEDAAGWRPANYAFLDARGEIGEFLTRVEQHSRVGAHHNAEGIRGAARGRVH